MSLLRRLEPVVFRHEERDRSDVFKNPDKGGCTWQTINKTLWKFWKDGAERWRRKNSLGEPLSDVVAYEETTRQYIGFFDDLTTPATFTRDENMAHRTVYVREFKNRVQSSCSQKTSDERAYIQIVNRVLHRSADYPSLWLSRTRSQ